MAGGPSPSDCPVPGARPEADHRAARHLVDRLEIDQIATDHETHNFEPQAKFENGLLLFLIKLLIVSAGASSGIVTNISSMSTEFLTERSLEHGDCGLVPPGVVCLSDLQRGEDERADQSER